MQCKEIKIEEMRIRLPGMNETEAQEIRQIVLRAVSTGIPDIYNIKYY
jgi:hypothetical protein